MARYAAAKSNVIRTDAGDDSYMKGDDHIVLIMGESRGELIWRQTSTQGLLKGFN